MKDQVDDDVRLSRHSVECGLFKVGLSSFLFFFFLYEFCYFNEFS